MPGAPSPADNLLKLSEHPSVSIYVIPFDAGGHPGSGQPIYYIHGPVPELDNWQKSIYCGEGESCLHVATTAARFHVTESAPPTQPYSPPPSTPSPPSSPT